MNHHDIHENDDDKISIESDTWFAGGSMPKYVTITLNSKDFDLCLYTTRIDFLEKLASAAANLAAALRIELSEKDATE